MEKSGNFKTNSIYYDCETKKWVKIDLTKKISPRMDHTMCTSWENSVVVFGGTGFAMEKWYQILESSVELPSGVWINDGVIIRGIFIVF